MREHLGYNVCVCERRQLTFTFFFDQRVVFSIIKGQYPKTSAEARCHPFLLSCSNNMTDKNLQHFEFTENCVNEEASKNETKNDQDTTSKKCNSGEKSKKCNQCIFASSEASDLRTHLKTHSGEKPNKCNQCDFARCSLPTIFV